MSYDHWRYDEFHQVGKDYAQQDEAEIYDQRHSDFRNLEQESEELLDRLAVSRGQVLVDLGCGTGVLAIQAARRGAVVHAVDVSQAMLGQAGKRAGDAGVSVAFHHGGFLTYEHQAEPADFLTTAFALHHLPDFWKGVALERLAAMLKPGGIFFLRDVVVEQTAPLDQALANAQAFVDELDRRGGENMKKDAECHLREEFSTFDWIMEGLLSRAGFDIRDKQITAGVMADYLCVRA